jgi:hypothetical protein
LWKDFAKQKRHTQGLKPSISGLVRTAKALC